MSFQNTNEEIFNETWEISVPPLRVHETKTFTVQKIHKDILQVL